MTVPSHRLDPSAGADDARSVLESVVRDLEAHLRWRGDAGCTRLPDASSEAGGGGVARELGALERPAAERPSPAEGATSAAETAPKPKEASSGAPAPSGGAQGSTLESVRLELGDCERCKLSGGRRNLVFGVGNPRAELVFVGEGPGAQEDEEGEPFVGAAGQLLDRMIAAMGYSREDVYICNVVKCRPPRNRDPEPEEVAACEPFLIAQLAAIQPKVIVGLGRFAVQCLLRDPEASVGKVRGRWERYEDIDLMPTFHPAYLLRDPSQKAKVWKDLQAVMARLGRSPR